MFPLRRGHWALGYRTRWLYRWKWKCCRESIDLHSLEFFLISAWEINYWEFHLRELFNCELEKFMKINRFRWLWIELDSVRSILIFHSRRAYVRARYITHTHMHQWMGKSSKDICVVSGCVVIVSTLPSRKRNSMLLNCIWIGYFQQIVCDASTSLPCKRRQNLLNIEMKNHVRCQNGCTFNMRKTEKTIAFVWLMRKKNQPYTQVRTLRETLSKSRM